MKWFDQWFAKKCEWAWDQRNKLTASRDVPVMAVENDSHGLQDGLSIHLKQVIGGRLVTFRSYDRKRDENNVRTYIITEEQDFERELGKIITLESMRS